MLVARKVTSGVHILKPIENIQEPKLTTCPLNIPTELAAALTVERKRGINMIVELNAVILQVKS